MEHSKAIAKYMILYVLHILYISNIFAAQSPSYNSDLHIVYSDNCSFSQNKTKIYTQIISLKANDYNTFAPQIEKLPESCKADYFLQFGKFLYKKNEYSNASLCLKKALKGFTQRGITNGIADCYFYLGKIAAKKNNSDTLLVNINKSFNLYEEIRQWDGAIVCNMTIANYFSQNNNFKLADNYYNKAHLLLDSTQNRNIKEQVILNIANHYNKKKQYNEALMYYIQLEDFLSNFPNPIRQGNVLNNIGSVYIKKNNWEKALKYLERALLYKKKTNDQVQIASTIQNLFIVCVRMKDRELALHYKNTFTEISANNNLPTQLMLDFYYNCIEFYYMNGDFENSLLALKKYDTLKDSLSNIAFSDKLIEMQKSFELKEKDREIALLEKEDTLKQARIKNKNIIIIAVSIIAVLLMVLGYILYSQRKELIQSKKYLIRQKDDISGMNEQLRVSNLAKDRILSIIGHDLRGPVGGLKELIELYMDLPEYEEDDIENLLIAARESSTSTYHLLDNLLSWANSQRGDIEFKPLATPLAPLVKHSVKLLDKSINTRHITFSYDIPNTLEVQVDINMLRTIIRNLVSNAIKYSPEKSEVKIIACLHKNSVHLSICDNGSGMTREETQSIFTKKEIYFIGSEFSAKGTGLGLILCKEFVERHGGRIWIESEKGNGTKVIFSLPHAKHSASNIVLEEALES